MDRKLFLLSQLEAIAKNSHDGHLTVLRFTTNWRIGFGTMVDREDVAKLADGVTFEDAAGKVIANPKIYVI